MKKEEEEVSCDPTQEASNARVLISLSDSWFVPEMAYSSACFTSVAILFLLQPLIARSGFLPPLQSPILDDVCKKVECGQGACKPSRNSTWFYECECDPGWKQVSSVGHKFLPCIVPNCTLNFSCMPAPSPVQDKASKDNESIFDPCFWTDCGGGSCNKTSTFTHSCTCAEGYNNLLNISAFPCYRDCAIGVDCQNLGISVSNKSASSTPVMVDSSKNQDSSILQEKFHWLMALIVLLSMIDWV